MVGFEELEKWILIPWEKWDPNEICNQFSVLCCRIQWKQEKDRILRFSGGLWFGYDSGSLVGFGNRERGLVYVYPVDCGFSWSSGIYFAICVHVFVDHVISAWVWRVVSIVIEGTIDEFD